MDDVLGEVLECSVCLNQLDTTARVLPCQHTFCYGCLEDICRSNTELRCPECRVLIEVPIECLPTNILLMRILEGFKKKPPPPQPVNNLVEVKQIDPPPVTTDFSYILNLYNTPTTAVTTVLKNSSSSVTTTTTPNAFPQQSFSSPNVTQSFSHSSHTPVTKASSTNPFMDQSPHLLSHSLTSSPVPFLQNNQVTCPSMPLSSQVTVQSSPANSCSSNLSISHPNLSQDINNSPSSQNILPIAPSIHPLQRLSSTSSLSSLPAVTSHSITSLSAANSSSNINSLESFVSGGNCSSTGSNVQTLVGSNAPIIPSGRTNSFEKICNTDMRRQALTLYDYNSSKPRDLVFSKNSVVTIIKMVDCNWYIGEHCGKRGFLPSNYVRLLSPTPSPPLDTSKGVALYDFKLEQQQHLGNRNTSANDCLTFNKGDLIKVIRRVDQNWAEGSIGDKTGIFPLNFVKLNFSAATLLDVAAQQNKPNVSQSIICSPFPHYKSTPPSKSPEPTPLSIPAHTGLPSSCKAQNTATNMAMLYVARFSYTPLKADEVELVKGSLYAVLQKCQDGWYKGRCLTTHQTGVFPGNYLYPARGETIAEYLTRRTSGVNGSTAVISQADDTAMAGSGGAPPPVGPRMNTSLSSYSPSSPSVRVRLDVFTGSSSRDTKVMSASPMRDRYQCIEAYPASTPRELSLEVGDVVYILEQQLNSSGGELDRGWLHGFLRRTGESGVFPATFVEPL